MTPRTHTIILAGTQPDLAAMAALLVERQFTVHHCGDGEGALEQARGLTPDLVIVDAGLGGIGAAHLAQTFRSNPRFKDLSLIFIGREGEQVAGFQRHRDRFLARPFNPEQLLGEILSHLAQREQARQATRIEKEMEGNLQQVSLVDLLQIFGLNRKSGVLTVQRGGERGSVFLLEGAVINAKLGRVEGEKALFRLLAWVEGKFEFAPGQPGSEARIHAPTDHLLMEGLRQGDEMAAQIASLPGRELILGLKIRRDSLPEGLRPATRDIVSKLEYFPRVGDLLDQCAVPDFEALQILRVLLEKGFIEERSGLAANTPAELPLLAMADLVKIRNHLGCGDNPLTPCCGKLLLPAAAPAAVQTLAQALRGIAEFEVNDHFLQKGQVLTLGSMGRLQLSETVALRLLVVPGREAMAPLWRVLRQHCLGVALLGQQEELREAERYFADGTGPALALVGPGATGENGFPLKRGDRAGLRALLTFFADRLTEGPAAREVS